MSDEAKPYRTLIKAVIEQTSALSVGGALDVEAGPDGCYRDGLGRLTIPGTSLAGALIESAVRIFPDVVSESNDKAPFRCVTGKERALPQVKNDREDEVERFLQSVWRFRHSHPCDNQGNLIEEKDRVKTEWRQGVGIRQATGASAAEKKALYDVEVVPRGTKWSFFLEIDTSGDDGEAAEALAVLALNEWVAGRGWLGRSPARGTGWITLSSIQIIPLPCTPKALEAWPDNRCGLNAALARAIAAGATEICWPGAHNKAQRVAKDWRSQPWHYLTFDVSLSPGASANRYGYDVIQVSGHPAGELFPVENDVRPLSVLSVERGQQVDNPDWRGDKFTQPDSPLVRTRPADQQALEPFLPGGGLRGPLRHAVSRLARISNASGIRDPNWKDDRLAEQLSDKIRAAKTPLRDSDIRMLLEHEIGRDWVTALFGAEELSSRLLVRDARLVPKNGANPDERYRVYRVEHHAEDEFCAGVYGSDKFDRDALADCTLQFQIVLEAPTVKELRQTAQQLLPALTLAELGHVPIGGGKWRGAGWVPWTFDKISYSIAGGDQAATNEEMAKGLQDRLDTVLGPAAKENVEAK